MATVFEELVICNGGLRSSNIIYPAGSIDNADIAAGADIAGTKLECHFTLPYWQVHGTAVVAATAPLKIMRATGTLMSVEAQITGVIATGGDRTVDVDLQRSVGTGAPATMLSAAIQFTSASVLRTTATATLAATSLADGDALYMVITVAGAAGNQAQGLLVTVHIREKAA